MQNGKQKYKLIFKNAQYSVSLASGQQIGLPINSHIAMDSEEKEHEQKHLLI